MDLLIDRAVCMCARAPFPTLIAIAHYVTYNTQLAVKVPKSVRELEEAERELKVNKNVTCPGPSGTGNYW